MAWQDVPCKIWSGTKSRGYGYRKYGGKMWRVHRLAWELTYGPIPTGMNVLHHCDVMLCHEPTHLFLGTQRSNVHDMIAKGRQVAPGYPVGKRNLTVADVQSLQLLRERGYTYAELGRLFDITEGQVQRRLGRLKG